LIWVLRNHCSCQTASTPDNRCHEEAMMLKTGEKAPSLVATSYEGGSYSLGALGKRTVLWL